MNIIDKVNNTRYTLKEILKDEWDTSTISDLSNIEVEKIYTTPASKIKSLSLFGVASGCNFTLKHKLIPSHNLHVIYYNFPEIGRLNSKVTKSACDKLIKLYEEELIQFEDSLLVIINDTISESLENSFNILNNRLQSELDDKGLNEDIINEIKLILILNGTSYSEEIKDQLDQSAIQSIIKRTIKKIEIEKHNSLRFNPKDVDDELEYNSNIE